MTVALSRRTLLAAASGAALARPALVRAQIGAPVRVGEINSYASQPLFGRPYRLGWEMAVAHINDLGGLDGRKLEFVTRDDGGDPAMAGRLAAELVEKEKVDLLAGGLSSEAGLAISAYAASAKRLYVAGAPRTDALVWQQGNRYTYRVAPSTSMLVAMLVEGAKMLPPKTALASWATVAPDTPDGRAAVASFRQAIQAHVPGVRFVAEQFVPPGRLDAPAVVAALGQPSPDAVFNAVDGADLVALVREGGARGLFNGRTVLSMRTGDPEMLELLGNDTPPGWVATGYPFSLSDDPSSRSFVSDYVARYNEPPGMASVIGVSLANAIASGVLKSGGTDPEAMADRFADASFTTPFGICRFRTIDHQSTLGAYVGQLAKQDGHGGMVNWRLVDGAAVQPPDSTVRALRPA